VFYSSQGSGRGPAALVFGWTLAAGLWMLDTGCWILDTGYWLLDAGHWILATGHWKLATGHNTSNYELLKKK